MWTREAPCILFFWRNQCLRPPMNGEAFALSTSLFWCSLFFLLQVFCSSLYPINGVWTMRHIPSSKYFFFEVHSHERRVLFAQSFPPPPISPIYLPLPIIPSFFFSPLFPTNPKSSPTLRGISMPANSFLGEKSFRLFVWRSNKTKKNTTFSPFSSFFSQFFFASPNIPQMVLFGNGSTTCQYQGVSIKSMCQ